MPYHEDLEVLLWTAIWSVWVWPWGLAREISLLMQITTRTRGEISISYLLAWRLKHYQCPKWRAPKQKFVSLYCTHCAEKTGDFFCRKAMCSTLFPCLFFGPKGHVKGRRGLLEGRSVLFLRHYSLKVLHCKPTDHHLALEGGSLHSSNQFSHNNLTVLTLALVPQVETYFHEKLFVP